MFTIRQVLIIPLLAEEALFILYFITGIQGRVSIKAARKATRKANI